MRFLPCRCPGCQCQAHLWVSLLKLSFKRFVAERKCWNAPQGRGSCSKSRCFCSIQGKSGSSLLAYFRGFPSDYILPVLVIRMPGSQALLRKKWAWRTGQAWSQHQLRARRVARKEVSLQSDPLRKHTARQHPLRGKDRDLGCSRNPVATRHTGRLGTEERDPARPWPLGLRGASLSGSRNLGR